LLASILDHPFPDIWRERNDQEHYLLGRVPRGG
jgi:hypothetical protein